jgi:hypothetical protein
VVAADRPVQRTRTCGEAWIALLRHVWTAGEAGLADHGPIIEGPPVLLEIASLGWDDPLLRRHGDRERLARRAHERTRGGDAPEHPPWPHDAQGAARIRWVTGLLRARPWTTSAWISLAMPPADESLHRPHAAPPGSPAGDPEAPCLAALAFRIRGYRLIMTAMFRSQDVVRCYLSHIPLREVQLRVAEELGLPAGPLRIFIDVPHIRLADADRVARILTAQPEPNAA